MRIFLIALVFMLSVNTSPDCYNSGRESNSEKENEPLVNGTLTAEQMAVPAGRYQIDVSSRT